MSVCLPSHTITAHITHTTLWFIANRVVMLLYHIYLLCGGAVFLRVAVVRTTPVYRNIAVYRLCGRKELIVIYVYINNCVRSTIDQPSAKRLFPTRALNYICPRILAISTWPCIEAKRKPSQRSALDTRLPAASR